MFNKLTLTDERRAVLRDVYYKHPLHYDDAQHTIDLFAAMTPDERAELFALITIDMLKR